MSTQHKIFRFTTSEIKTLSILAQKQGMNHSDYIKHRLFDQNPDAAVKEDKFMTPNVSKHSYVVAFNLIRIQQLIKRLALKEEIVTEKELALLCSEDTENIRKLLEGIGYQKIIKESNE